MLTPVRLIVAGVVVFAIGFAFGTFNVDPLSAWIGTAGMVLAAAGLIWLVASRISARSNA